MQIFLQDLILFPLVVGLLYITRNVLCIWFFLHIYGRHWWTHGSIDGHINTIKIQEKTCEGILIVHFQYCSLLSRKLSITTECNLFNRFAATHSMGSNLQCVILDQLIFLGTDLIELIKLVNLLEYSEFKEESRKYFIKIFTISIMLYISVISFISCYVSLIHIRHPEFA